MMDCHEFTSILARAEGDDLSEEESVAVEHHAEGCDACRAEIDAASEDLRAMAGMLGRREPSAEEWAAVMGAIGQAMASPEASPEGSELSKGSEPSARAVPSGGGGGRPASVTSSEPSAVIARPPSRGKLSAWIAAAASIAVAAALVLSVVVPPGEPAVNVVNPTPLAQGEDVRVDALETAADVVAVTMLPTHEDDVLVIFVSNETEEGQGG